MALLPPGAAVKKIITARRAIGLLPPGSLAHLHCRSELALYEFRLQIPATLRPSMEFCRQSGLRSSRSRIELFLLSKRRVSIVAVSEHCKKTLENMAELCRPIVVIPNGVPGASTSLPARMDSTVNVGLVGFFSFNKGIHTFLEVARLLKHMPARFTVFGNGPEYCHGCRSRPKEDLIRWIDSETDPAKLYPQIDILVFPSQLEGCPMVILEAMSHGVATVSSDIPGVREIIESGKEGLLVGSWAASDYAAAVERLITDSETRRAFSKRAKEKWASSFNAELMAKRYMLLASLIRN